MVQTDWWCRIPAIRLADAHVGGGSSTKIYQFAWPSKAFGRTPRCLPRPRGGLRLRHPGTNNPSRCWGPTRHNSWPTPCTPLGVLRDHRRLRVAAVRPHPPGHRALQHHRARRGRSASGGTGTVAGPTLARQGPVETALIFVTVARAESSRVLCACPNAVRRSRRCRLVPYPPDSRVQPTVVSPPLTHHQRKTSGGQTISTLTTASYSVDMTARRSQGRSASPVKPVPGQESMWDYPRPPRLEIFVGSITVELGCQTIASTTRAWRVRETSHPPT